MKAVSVHGLRKAYGGTSAVDGLDLELDYGEVVALLGPNGAGKTTAIEIIEGHRPRDGGEVHVLGVDPAHATRAWRAQLGIVAQGTTDVGELTVGETVAHFARYFPKPRPPHEVIGLVGLTHKAGARVRTLSGGQRRRLDVAVGVVGRPRVLFLDEPTTGFDPQARRQFWELIGSLAAEDTTILLTTHYLDEAQALADRLVVIDQGRAVATGTPATLGDRTLAPATVSWLDDGLTHHRETTDPTAVVAELIARFGATVPGLEVTRPTLEDIYLALISREKS